AGNTSPIVTSILVVSALIVTGAVATFILLRRRRANQLRSGMLLNTAAYDSSAEETHFL
ncbi:hypothetical protein V5799_031942, partial [Amblyomma americanum]